MVTRDFGQTANVKGSRDALRVDKAVGNHVDSVSIAILANPTRLDSETINDKIASLHFVYYF